MNKSLNKTSLLFSAALIAALSLSGCADSKNETTAETSSLSFAETTAVSDAEQTDEAVTEEAEPSEESDDFLAVLSGENGTEYVNLFDVILQDDYHESWYNYFAAVTGEESAEALLASVQGSVSSDIYGKEASDKYSGTDGYAFNCSFINGADTFLIKDNTITVKHKDGTKETHTYENIGTYNIGEGETMNYMGTEFDLAFPCTVYKSTDDAGEFTYFFFRDDTMETTWHLEFRYGSSMEELQGYMKGEYAYWLAAGFDSAADDETIEKVIQLFCLENMDYSQRSDASLSQVSELTGTWDADLTPFGEEYAGTELYIVIDENGHGMTYMNGENTADFNAYMFDSGEKGDGIGTYVAYSNFDFEAEAADHYELKTDENGKNVWTLYSDEGVISYIKR